MCAALAKGYSFFWSDQSLLDFHTRLHKHWSTPTRRRPAPPRPSGRACRVQHHHEPYEPPARSARGRRALRAGRTAHGLARDAMPEERRCNQPRRVPLPLARLWAPSVCVVCPWRQRSTLAASPLTM